MVRATQPANEIVSIEIRKWNMWNILRTCDVSTGPCWTDNCDGVSHSVCQLEVAVNEVANLDQDPRPVDAVDGAQVVLCHVLRVRKHRLDWDIQVI